MSLIAKLKNNDAHRIYADMTPDEQACLKEVGPKNCDILSGFNENEGVRWFEAENEPFRIYRVYRIKPSYQSELVPKVPEYDNYKIKRIGHRLVITYHTLKAYQDIPIHECPSLSGFRGFWADKGMGYSDADVFYEVGKVACRMAAGWDIKARFER